MCCGPCMLICKLPGMLLNGCCPFAIGVYIGLLLMMIANFSVWGATIGNAILYTGATGISVMGVSMNVEYELTVGYSAISTNGVRVEIENSEPNAMCHDSYTSYQNWAGLLHLATFGGMFLMVTGQLWWWPGMNLFSKIPCKKCAARIMLWFAFLFALLTLLVYSGGCGLDLKNATDATAAIGGTGTFEAGSGATGLLYGAILYPISSLILTIFFAPKGQKLIPGFNAEEVGVEVEEVDADGNVTKTVVMNEDVNKNEETAKA